MCMWAEHTKVLTQFDQIAAKWNPMALLECGVVVAIAKCHEMVYRYISIWHGLDVHCFHSIVRLICLILHAHRIQIHLHSNLGGNNSQPSLWEKYFHLTNASMKKKTKRKKYDFIGTGEWPLPYTHTHPASGNTNIYPINWLTNYIFVSFRNIANRLIGLTFLLLFFVFILRVMWIVQWKLLVFDAGHRSKSIVNIDWLLPFPTTFSHVKWLPKYVQFGASGYLGDGIQFCVTHHFFVEAQFLFMARDSRLEKIQLLQCHGILLASVSVGNACQSSENTFSFRLANRLYQLSGNDIHFFARNTFIMENVKSNRICAHRTYVVRSTF